jgi:hypothetical protein
MARLAILQGKKAPVHGGAGFVPPLPTGPAPLLLQRPLLLGTPAAATPRLQGTPRPHGTPRQATIRPPMLNAAAVWQQAPMVSRFAYPGAAGQLRGAIAPLGASAAMPQAQPGPGNVLTMADGTTHVAPGIQQPAPGYGLNQYSYVAPHLRPAVQPQPQQYPEYLPAQQGRPQLHGAAYLQGAAQPYPGMYSDDGGQGFPPTPPTRVRLRRRIGSSSNNRRAARGSRFVWLPSHFPGREMTWRRHAGTSRIVGPRFRQTAGLVSSHSHRQGRSSSLGRGGMARSG